MNNATKREYKETQETLLKDRLPLLREALKALTEIITDVEEYATELDDMTENESYIRLSDICDNLETVLKIDKIEYYLTREVEDLYKMHNGSLEFSDDNE